MAAPLTFGVRTLACFTCQIAKKPNIFFRQAFSPTCSHSRTYIRDVKKFYRNATIATADGWYEINLDKKKLRTPAGSLFRVPNEALALAVATEWNAQEKIVKRHEMHLTNLCNSALDNPMRKTRKTLTDDIVSVLETDTMFYRVREPEELRLMLSEGWDPILQWANQKYNLTLEFTYGLVMPHIEDGEKEIIRRHLLSYSDWALFGYAEAITTAKSLLLVMALIDDHINVEKAVELAQLESMFQARRWGIVEWHHEMDKYDLRTRLAAATLFIHWCSEDSSVIQKASLIKL